MNIYKTQNGSIVAAVAPYSWGWLSTDCKSLEYGDLAPRDVTAVGGADGTRYSRIVAELLKK